MYSNWCEWRGNNCIKFRSSLPERVKGLIIDSVADIYLESDIQYFIDERKQKTPEQINFWKEAQGEDWEDVIREDTEIVMNMKTRDQYFKGKLNQIKCPVLFIGSLNDEFISNIGESMMRMTSQIEDSRLVLLNKGGHPAIWTCSDEFRQMTNMFINNLG